MNYAQDALWWRLTHPTIRDLASLLTAPPLWHTGCELPTRELLGEHGFRLLLAWDEQWQSDPQRQPENLNRNRYALGKYAEDLLAYWFTHAPHAKLLAANLPIYSHNTDGNSADNSTLGEIDYIVELNGTPYHLELACKYHGSATGEHMAGLNPRDTLARKQRKLQRQLALLATPEFRARGILKQMNVKMVGTTDDPVDDLAHHPAIAADSTFDIAIRPSFRPDKALKIDHGDYLAYLRKLEATTGYTIRRFYDLTAALAQRLDHFAAHGCIAADHGLEILRYAAIPDERALDNILALRFNDKPLTDSQIARYQTALLVWLGREYHRRGWVMQLHIGPIRNNNSRMYARLGADSGYDSIGDRPIADNLAALLDAMDKTNELPKTILYTINPRDNALLATMCGNFQAEGVRGKAQFGSGWWFNDQKDGMIEQLTTHAQMGILSTFVGMLTDSRSFLSYTRHEYFRRILCNLIGGWVEAGEAPRDLKLLGTMVENICYGNAARYFDQ